MKKLSFLLCFMLLTACASNIDVKSADQYGLRCLQSATAAPNWEACEANAHKTCGAQKATNIIRHEPTGSGSESDGYFISFQCGG